jgi:phage terminase large subunit
MRAADPHRTYSPQGSLVDLWKCRAEEILLDGPAGTGKTRGAQEKLHLAAEKHAGMRGLMCRKTRESMTETVLVTFEEKVLPVGHPALKGSTRANRKSYQYPNGSKIVVGGLNEGETAGKIMSGEYDIILFCEATEFTPADWEKALSRLRNGMMPYRQLIGDCNPGAPGHHLKKWADSGRLHRIPTRHEDNPVLYNEAKGEWTKEGKAYLAILEKLTGHRYKRLRLGEWAAVEGAIFPSFDRDRHVRERNGFARTILGAIPGFSNAACVLAARIDIRNRVHIAEEWFHEGLTYQELCQAAWQQTKRYKARKVIVRAGARALATKLSRKGMIAKCAEAKPGNVAGGIGLVRSRLGEVKRGIPMLTISSNCVHTIEEMESYGCQRGTDGKVIDDKPAEEFDRAMTALRLAILEIDGTQPPLVLERVGEGSRS